jgi:hypothetical protein
MFRRTLRTLLIYIVLMVSPLSALPVALASIDSWECQWTVNSFPVTGGTISGRGCRDVHSYNQFWDVWADTYAPWSTKIQTHVWGYDKCTGDADYVLRAYTSNEDLNTTYGTSGSKDGPFVTCDLGHTYKVTGYHIRWRDTGSPGWEGTVGNVYW